MSDSASLRFGNHLPAAAGCENVLLRRWRLEAPSTMTAMEAAQAQQHDDDHRQRPADRHACPARHCAWALAGLAALCASSLQAQTRTVDATAAAAVPAGWMWPALMALMLVTSGLLVALCLLLLRRDQALRGEIERLRASVAAPSTLPTPNAERPDAAAQAVPAGDTAPAADAVDNEHESFTYTVSHDLRAPIRVVEGFTRILKEDYGRVLDRIGNDHLDRVLGAAARMNSMIDSLLALSQLSSKPLARQPVDLSQLAGFVADDLRRQSPDREVALRIEPRMQVLGRSDAAAGGDREPARQCLEVHRAECAARDQLLPPSGRSRRPSPLPTTAPASTCALRIGCSASSSGCTARPITRGPVSAWPRCGASCAAMAATSGPKPKSIAARAFISRSGRPERRRTGRQLQSPAPLEASSSIAASSRSACAVADRPSAAAMRCRRARRGRARQRIAVHQHPDGHGADRIEPRGGGGCRLGPRCGRRRCTAPVALDVGKRRLDRRNDLPDVERLDQVGHRTELLHMAHRRIVGEGGQEHERHLAVVAQIGRDIEPAHAFHPDVEQRQIGTVLAREQDRVVAVVGIDHVVTRLREPVRQRCQHQPVVVHHQDPALVRHSTVVRALSAPSVPRAASAADRRRRHGPALLQKARALNRHLRRPAAAPLRHRGG